MSDEKPVYKWEIRNLSHAYQERKPTEYIVDKFFSAGSLNVVYGSPGSMKSMILADLCIAVAAGQDWLPGLFAGGAGIPVQQSPFLWVDMDNGKRRTDERMDAIAKARNLPETCPNVHYVSMPMPPLNVADLDALIYFKTVIRDLGARLVVVDNLGLITGDIEENSAGMAMVMGYLRQIADDTDTALVVIHHQRKGGAGQNGRPGDALRGHSSIEAALDLALHVVREPESSEATIRSTKTRGVDVPTISAYFNYEHRDGTSDLERAWFSGVEKVRGQNPVRDTILYMLEGGQRKAKTLLINQVYDHLKEDGVSRAKIRGWLDDMVNVTKEVCVEKGEYNAQIVYLGNGL